LTTALEYVVFAALLVGLPVLGLATAGLLGVRPSLRATWLSAAAYGAGAAAVSMWKTLEYWHYGFVDLNVFRVVTLVLALDVIVLAWLARRAPHGSWHAKILGAAASLDCVCSSVALFVLVAGGSGL
jgi:hypothetical protein